MLGLGITSLFLSLVLGVYSSFSLHPKLMVLRLFWWLPIAGSYRNALAGIEKLQRTVPSKRNFYDDAFGVPKQEIGKVSVLDVGFSELAKALRTAGISSETFDSVELVKTTAWDNNAVGLSENTTTAIKLWQGNEVIKEITDKPLETIRDAVEKALQPKFAVLTLVMTVVLFALGVLLVVIDLRSKK